MKRVLIVAALVALSPVARAQVLPVRPLGPITTTSRETIGDLAGVRVLGDGRVLVNDRGKRRLILLDTSLSRFDAVFDVAVGGPTTYPNREAILFPGIGDTSLVLDYGAASLIVIDPAGRVDRVISMPRFIDVAFMFGVGYGQPIVDSAARLIYRRRGYSVAGADTDSDPILRVDFDTRRVDTVEHLARRYDLRGRLVEDSLGRQVVAMRVRPFIEGDDWAAFPNGTVAIVRAHDYHVDWVEPNGTVRSTAPVKWNWVRLTDDDKMRIVDSLNVALTKADSITDGQAASNSNPAVQLGSGAGGGGGGAAAKVGGGTRLHQTRSVDPSELPDYPPPFLRATRIDQQGRLWVTERPTKENVGGVVYDIIDHTGQIVDRVQAPAGYSVVGFAPGGIVYLAGGTRAVVRIAKASIAPRPK
jgi:hypothetical protein